MDVGCGDGLVGEALKLRGFTNLIGTDISEKMVQLAERKNFYKTVFQADLMKPLNLESQSFDLLTCVGVTTYLEPRVIREWCRVVTTGNRSQYPPPDVEGSKYFRRLDCIYC